MTLSGKLRELEMCDINTGFNHRHCGEFVLGFFEK